MIDPEIGKAGFRIAITLVAAALFMLPFEDPSSPGFYATIFTLMVGFLFVLLIFVLARIAR